jgi:hypothetical protein
MRNYKALVTIGVVYKVLGVIVGIITLAAVVGFCLWVFTGGTAMMGLGRRMGAPAAYALVIGIIVGGIQLIYGATAALTLYTFGAGLQLLVSVAKDTQEALALLRGREPEYHSEGSNAS